MSEKVIFIVFLEYCLKRSDSESSLTADNRQLFPKNLK